MRLDLEQVGVVLPAVPVVTVAAQFLFQIFRFVVVGASQQMAVKLAALAAPTSARTEPMSQLTPGALRRWAAPVGVARPPQTSAAATSPAPGGSASRCLRAALLAPFLEAAAISHGTPSISWAVGGGGP